MAVDEKVIDSKYVEAVENERDRLAARVIDLEAKLANLDTPYLSEIKENHIWRNESIIPWVFHEEMSFIEDSGYDQNFQARAHAMVDRAFGVGKDKIPHRCGAYETIVEKNQPKRVWSYSKLPPFDADNRIVVTVKIIPAVK